MEEVEAFNTKQWGSKMSYSEVLQDSYLEVLTKRAKVSDEDNEDLERNATEQEIHTVVTGMTISHRLTV